MKRLALAPMFALVLLVGAGCPKATVGTVSPKQQFYNSYTTALADANVVYSEGMKAVGRAKAAGLCDGPCEAKALAAGHLAEASLHAAQDALVIYVRSAGDASAQSKVLAAVGEFNRILSDLTKLIAAIRGVR